MAEPSDKRKLGFRVPAWLISALLLIVTLLLALPINAVNPDFENHLKAITGADAYYPILWAIILILSVTVCVLVVLDQRKHRDQPNIAAPVPPSGSSLSPHTRSADSPSAKEKLGDRNMSTTQE